MNISEGALCNGAFEPLRPPRVFNFPSRLWELRCYPEFTGREIKEIEFRLGMMILTGAQHGYTGFPILPSIFERLVDLRQRRPRVPLPNPYKHKYAVIAASPITCEVEMNFIALPAINYTGQAVIFRTFEADSRNCGYMKPNGHDALAIVPYRIRQDSIQENIRIMLYHMKTTLRPFSKSLRFFTSGLRFHGVRVVIIEASFLYDEIAESPINMERVLPTTNRTVIFQPIVHNLLASLFMQGIVVCLATFDQTVQTASVRPQLVTVDDMPIFLSPGAPPSPTYLTLIKALATSFSGHVLEHQKGFRVASLSRTRQLYRPQPLVSLVVDGVQAAKVKGPIGKVHRELTGDLPVTQLINFWRDIASLHKNIEPEDTQRGLDESEILVVTTVSRDLVRCKRCVVVQSHGNKIELVELSIVS